jgi:hypothetical protein
MMADEQGNTPSADEQPTDAAAPEPSSDEPKEGSSPGWWQRLFNRRPIAQEDTPEHEESDQPGSSASDLPRTQEELQRRVQSEVDRREAKRAAEQRAEQRKKLRDQDPWAYAEEDRKAEQQAEQSQGIQSFFADVGTQHDRIAIDPLMEALPTKERQRIMQMEGAGRGLDGRKLVVDAALKALEKQWKAEGEKEAEARLRRNPAFRKQLLSEIRGNAPEPELLPAAQGSEADKTMSNIFREYYGIGGGAIQRHNSAG